MNLNRRLDSMLIQNKLADLSSSQEEIQSLSSLFIRFCEDADNVVQIWFKRFEEATSAKRLIYMYLCNDIIQKCIHSKTGLMYKQIFKEILPKVSSLISGSSIQKKIERIYGIWCERNVFETCYTDELVDLLNNVKREGNQLKADNELADFEVSELKSNLNKFEDISKTVELTRRKLVNCTSDASEIKDIISRVKDRSTGRKYRDEFERSHSCMSEYVQVLESDIDHRINLINSLHSAQKFYNEQYKDARIILSAYKNFSRRVRKQDHRVRLRMRDILRRNLAALNGTTPPSIGEDGSAMELEDDDEFEDYDLENDDDEDINAIKDLMPSSKNQRKTEDHIGKHKRIGDFVPSPGAYYQPPGPSIPHQPVVPVQPVPPYSLTPAVVPTPQIRPQVPTPFVDPPLAPVPTRIQYMDKKSPILRMKEEVNKKEDEIEEVEEEVDMELSDGESPILIPQDSPIMSPNSSLVDSQEDCLRICLSPSPSKFTNANIAQIGITADSIATPHLNSTLNSQSTSTHPLVKHHRPMAPPSMPEILRLQSGRRESPAPPLSPSPNSAPSLVNPSPRDTAVQLAMATNSPPPTSCQDPRVKLNEANLAGNLAGRTNSDGDSSSAFITGNMGGNMSVNMSGNMSGNMNGNMTGNMGGNMGGNMFGNMALNVAGKLAGIIPGHVPKPNSENGMKQRLNAPVMVNNETPPANPGYSADMHPGTARAPQGSPGVRFNRLSMGHNAPSQSAGFQQNCSQFFSPPVGGGGGMMGSMQPNYTSPTPQHNLYNSSLHQQQQQQLMVNQERTYSNTPTMIYTPEKGVHSYVNPNVNTSNAKPNHDLKSFNVYKPR